MLALFVNSPQSTLNPQIATISIHDPDSGDNGLYNIDVISANGRDPPSPFFIIFTFLSAEGRLDYEEESQYIVSIVTTERGSCYSSPYVPQLVLEVSDRGSPPLSTQAELLVTIQDADDNPPTFPVCYHQYIHVLQPFKFSF